MLLPASFFTCWKLCLVPTIRLSWLSVWLPACQDLTCDLPWPRTHLTPWLFKSPWIILTQETGSVNLIQWKWLWILDLNLVIQQELKETLLWNFKTLFILDSLLKFSVSLFWFYRAPIEQESTNFSSQEGDQCYEIPFKEITISNLPLSATCVCILQRGFHVEDASSFVGHHIICWSSATILCFPTTLYTYRIHVSPICLSHLASCPTTSWKRRHVLPDSTYQPKWINEVCLFLLLLFLCAACSSFLQVALHLPSLVPVTVVSPLPV